MSELLLRRVPRGLVLEAVTARCLALLKPGFFFLEREAATALLVAQLLTDLADLWLEGAIFGLCTVIPLIHILILPCNRLETADLINVLHAPTHNRICQRALTPTSAALARRMP